MSTQTRPAGPRPGCVGRAVVFLCGALVLCVWALQRALIGPEWLQVAAQYAPPAVWLAPVLVALIGGLASRGCAPRVLALALVGLVCISLMDLRLNAPLKPGVGPRIIVATWNVHNDLPNAPRARNTLNRLDVSLVLLQEASGELWQTAFDDWSRHGNAGQWICAQRPLAKRSAIPLGDSWRAAQAAALQVGGQTVGLLNVHLTTGPQATAMSRAGRDWREYLLTTDRARRTQIESLAVWAKAQPGPFIIAGDFNTPPAAAVWEPLEQLAVNAFAERGLGFGYTYRRDLPLWRIDHIWVSPHWRVLRCGMVRAALSDHVGVWAELELKDVPQAERRGQ